MVEKFIKSVQYMYVVSREVIDVLVEIVESLNIEHYCEKHFETISERKDAILRE